MNDPEPVCFFENVADLSGNLNCMRGGEATLARQRLGKCFAFDKLHHDEVTAVGQITRVKDHRGVRMVQLGHRSRFAQKTIGDVCITGKLAANDLYSNRTFEAEVRGEINRAHAAGPDFTFYSEPASDKLGDIHI